MDEKYVPKNEEERQLLEEFEEEMKKITEAKESAQSETNAIKKLIEAEREKRISVSFASISSLHSFNNCCVLSLFSCQTNSENQWFNSG